MNLALCILAAGVVIGIPIVLYGVMRIEEEGRRPGWIFVAIGLAAIAGPMTAAVVLHQDAAGTGRYTGR